MTDCSNYHGISFLSTSHKMLSDVFLSRLSPYIDEIIGDHQHGLQHNRSATDSDFLHLSNTKEEMGVFHIYMNIKGS
jgi:hypothetical protein